MTEPEPEVLPPLTFRDYLNIAHMVGLNGEQVITLWTFLRAAERTEEEQ